VAKGSEGLEIHLEVASNLKQAIASTKAKLLPSQPNESLIGGLQCLEAVVGAGHAVGTREVARTLGMNHTRVSRLVKTLAHLGLLTRTPEGRYRPGAGIHVLAALSLQGSPLLQVALPYVRRWWSEGFNVALGVLWKDNVCHLLHARPEWPFDRAIGGHEISPAGWSTAGIALLAAKPPQDTHDLQQPGRPAWARPDESLQDMVEQARRVGYGCREYADGTVSLGVTVGNDPPLAGLAVSRQGITPTVRDDVVAGLRETAAAIAGELKQMALARDGR
jgi:DNA-binding IclR family transcriptional regulator